MLSTLCVSRPNAASFTFAQIVSVLATVRSFIVGRAPLTHTPDPRVPEHMVLSQAGTRRGQPCPGAPGPPAGRRQTFSPRGRCRDSSSAPGPRRLLGKEVFFTHRDKGSLLEYTNHKFMTYFLNKNNMQQVRRDDIG